MEEFSNIVIIPTYKERENIEAIIRAISSQSIPFNILIIDDNSPDGTASILLRIFRNHSRICFLSKDQAKWDWVQHILQVLNGLWKKVIIIFMKWMQIFRTIPAI
jgi:glycosyltransferase involved in cell wall biosynthesis